MRVTPQRAQRSVGDPRLPPEFAFEVLAGAFIAEDVIREHTPVSLVDHAERNDHVVDVVVAKGAVQGTTHGEYGTIGADGTAPRAFRLLDHPLQRRVKVCRLGDGAD